MNDQPPRPPMDPALATGCLCVVFILFLLSGSVWLADFSVSSKLVLQAVVLAACGVALGLLIRAEGGR